MEKPILSDFLRREIQSQYGSVSSFADTVGLPYERLKKALQRNRFSKEDLLLITEKLRLTNFNLNSYTYSFGRRHLQIRTPLLSKTIEGIIPEEYMLLVVNNPIVLERVRMVVSAELRRISAVIGEISKG